MDSKKELEERTKQIEREEYPREVEGITVLTDREARIVKQAKQLGEEKIRENYKWLEKSYEVCQKERTVWKNKACAYKKELEKLKSKKTRWIE